MFRQTSRFILAIFLISQVFSSSSYAREMPWTHYGVRPMAMGNAFVSVVDDFNTIFYNPAGLARIQSWDGEFFNPTFGWSKNTSSFYRDATNLLSSSSNNTESTLDLIENNAGRTQQIGLGITPHLIFPNFGIGLGLQMNGSFVFHRYPSVDVNIGPDVIIPISGAMSFFEGRLAVGAGVKMRVRGGVNSEFSIEDIGAFSKNNKEEGGPKIDDYISGGSGFGGDVGLLFTPIETMKPTLGISITDIGSTSFKKFNVSGEAKLGTPDVVLPAVNVGVSARPIQIGSQYLLVAVDMHAINHPVSFSKKFNLGMEWGWGNLFKVQGGFHHGYLTAGFQFDVGLLNIRVATYGEEVGPTAGSLEDRRFVVQMKLLI